MAPPLAPMTHTSSRMNPTDALDLKQLVDIATQVQAALLREAKRAGEAVKPNGAFRAPPKERNMEYQRCIYAARVLSDCLQGLVA